MKGTGTPSPCIVQGSTILVHNLLMVAEVCAIVASTKTQYLVHCLFTQSDCLFYKERGDYNTQNTQFAEPIRLTLKCICNFSLSAHKASFRYLEALEYTLN